MPPKGRGDYCTRFASLAMRKPKSAFERRGCGDQLGLREGRMCCI
jgi:hypothetical protein